MAFMKRSDLLTAYQRIRRVAHASSKACSLLILAAPTVDALCALRILSVPVSYPFMIRICWRAISCHLRLFQWPATKTSLPQMISSFKAKIRYIWTPYLLTFR